jgi:hypothetical protein
VVIWYLPSVRRGIFHLEAGRTQNRPVPHPRQRQQILDVEDEIEARRDQFIEALEKRLKQKTLVHPVFRIRWQLA